MLSSIVPTDYLWLFTLKQIKLHFFGALPTFQVLRNHRELVATVLGSSDKARLYRRRKVLRLALSRGKDFLPFAW